MDKQLKQFIKLKFLERMPNKSYKIAFKNLPIPCFKNSLRFSNHYKKIGTKFGQFIKLKVLDKFLLTHTIILFYEIVRTFYVFLKV